MTLRVSYNFLLIISIAFLYSCQKKDDVKDDPGPVTPYDKAENLDNSQATPAKIRMQLDNRQGWKVIYTDSQSKSKREAPKNAIDNKPSTIWHSNWQKTPHEIQIDMGKEFEVVGFTQLSRQNKTINGLITKYDFFVSNDPKSWGPATFSGEFKNVAADRSLRVVYFEDEKGNIQRAQGRYIRLVSKATFKNKPPVAIAELNILIEE
jgi:hypothetical protein